VDIVIDATGYCPDRHTAEQHLRQGAQKVIATQPMEDEDLTVIMGVNHQAYDPQKHHVLSASSCTANCLAPVADVLQRRAGLVEGMMTTIHAITNSQSLLDKARDDARLSRSAHLNIVPTKSGAVQEVSHIVPALKGKFMGSALRVPIPTVSILDLTAHLAQPLTIEQVNQAFREAAAGYLHGILTVTDDELVSSDFVGDERSAIVDAKSTMTAGPLVKVNAWYDNEWGYAHRVADLTHLVAQHLEEEKYEQGSRPLVAQTAGGRQ
jgi:glyceraldehyde 3-phosphate dehydrogenase